jgi:hypothetical protein
MRRRILALSICLAAACGDGPASPDARGVDAAPPDAALPDAAPPDASAPDASVPDASAPDASAPDASAPDASPPDAPVVPPSIAALEPTTGPTSGGTPLVITGTGFAAGATVAVDGQPAAVAEVTATRITATAPAAPGRAGPREVVVTNPDAGRATTTFTYYYGTLAFEVTAALPTGVEPRGILAVDLDADGDLDLATVHRNNADPPGRIAINLGDGAGGFAPAVGHPITTAPTSLAAGDYDHDGDLDLATVGSDGVALLWATGGGGFAPWTTADRWFQDDLLRLAGGDLDGDGDADLALGLRNASRGLLGLTFAPGAAPTGSAIAGTAVDVLAVATARIDGDRHLDAIGAGSGVVVLARGLGDGSFAPPVSYPAGVTGYAQQLATGDLDGDGDLEVVAATFGGAGLTIHPNSGDGTLGPPIALPTAGNFCGGVAVLDVDRDGRRDLVAAHLGGNLAIYRNLGGLTFAPAITVVVPGRLRDIATGDFDRDGQLDLAIHDEQAGTAVIARGVSR